ncbi:succinate dehydrogenase [Prescottella agglutinans]|uniref:Succinate dehydrogenase n=1 Tax=Prescottella agglutinans TaxID=1644129 RepID=A0A438BH48_9NOCA|nr:succinate dehydrogenase [Prescottella agglutinans]RVW10171.1 succinate dehydrogenase [Prescottella agglutinans]
MTACRVNWWTALAAAVLLVATGVLASQLTHLADASASAGREYGESQAVMYKQFTARDPSDLQIRQWCSTGAQISAATQIWYRGGIIQVGELDQKRFVEGCFETYRAATR